MRNMMIFALVVTLTGCGGYHTTASPNPSPTPPPASMAATTVYGLDTQEVPSSTNPTGEGVLSSVIEIPMGGTFSSQTASILSLNQVDHYQALAVDASGYIYVASVNQFDATQGSVLVFAPNANGAVAPLRTITLQGTPDFVKVDSTGNIYVATAPFPSNLPVTILKFAAGANGNAAPIRTITIPISTTGVGSPEGLTVDHNGNIIYALYTGTGSDTIQVFAAGPSASSTPVRTISGPQSQLLDIFGLAVDSAGNIYAPSQTQLDKTPSVIEFSGGTSGTATPINTISGNATMLNTMNGIAIDAADNIYITGGAAGLLRFSRGATGNVSPVIEGSGLPRFTVH